MSKSTSKAQKSEQSKTSQKRKRDEDLEELEVDVNAPEPPSKKELRKAKKSKTEASKSSSGKDEQTKAVRSDETGVVGDQGKRSQYGIWIGNLSFTTTKQDLQDFMTNDQDYQIKPEQVTRINLPSGQSRNGKAQNKGFAYIDLVDEATLRKALELSERLLSGRRVLIKDAKNFEGRPKAEEKPVEGKAPSRRIFVGNLSFDTTKERLEEHFGACGSVHHIQVATFEDSGKCKGYAWVQFEQLSSAQAAMRGWVEEARADDAVKASKRRIWLQKMDGRKLRMEYAEDATTRYNKRFGKGAKSRADGEENEGVTEVETGAGDVTQEKGTQQSKEPAKSKDKRKEYASGKGYAAETVKKLQGAIVESQGQKVVFD